MKDALIKKIKDKEARVGIVGLGYVGLPLAAVHAKSGFKTMGFDLSEPKVALINKGENYIKDIEDETLRELVETGMLSATTDFTKIGEMDFIAICVPSPLDKHEQPDMSYIEGASELIGKSLKKGTLVVLESTTYPGTTQEVVKPILEKESGLVCGEDFYLGFSPERVDPGNPVFKTSNTPKVIGGINPDATDVMEAMYTSVLASSVYRVSSPAIAEMEKILENTYRNINIGLINEMAILCNKMDINIWEVIEAAKSKPFGFQAFYPGPGLGGHCIPLDPAYLSWKAKEYLFHTSMIESSTMINDKMPEYCIDRAAKILNRYKKALNGSRVLVLGVAYKQDIDDYRESASIKIIDLFKRSGCEVDWYDPFIPEYFDRGEKYVGIDSIDPEVIASYDLVVITTAHTTVDYDMIQKNAAFVFDTRNAMKNVKDRSNIELL
ncbi:MAG: nucleotide sugar dehydrogenase [Mogibacterium sp.]|nr:nucleotide sugar dehydrogenase [Mogibacterium sp.]